MQQIRAQHLADWLADTTRPQPLLLDVREAWEYEHCHLPGAVLIPMHLIPARQQEIDPDRDVVVICHHGVRSMQVAMFLERQGHERLFNLTGGVAAWADEVDPSMPRY